ncbi:MAG: DUF128 domain-containing protein [Deltaproteobacteria bacterium]|nr:DUF128 domain-containing protein [Deltaproteobacteria bacterium]MBW2067251.1 DUF128 domain-containing protein [Deltaproteobacteria bacterium]
MREDIKVNYLRILRILSQANGPLSSREITRRLSMRGYNMSERTVRLYLARMDKAGFTENLGKKGRIITELGKKEVEENTIFEKVSLLSSKIDRLTYLMTFDARTKTGTVVINISVMPHEILMENLSYIEAVFEHGYGMGKLVTVFKPGETIGGITIPTNHVGIGTVCSVTLNGVLLHHGIPVTSLFGGLLELRNHKPHRFAEVVYYQGTSIDPLEVFIRSRMTDYTGAITSGSGRIGAGFREMPAESRNQVIEIAQYLEEVGLGGFMIIGWPDEPVLDIPVPAGQIGSVVIGGLNPVAIIEEKGNSISSRALAALIDYGKLFPYYELRKHI